MNVGVLALVAFKGFLLPLAESPCVDRTVAETVRASRVVVVGKVMALTPADADGRPARPSEAVRGLYRVEVAEEFKGEGHDEYDLVADLPQPPPSLGHKYVHDAFGLDVGKKYLLFAWDEPLRVDPCASLPYDHATETLQAVRRPKAPKQ